MLISRTGQVVHPGDTIELLTSDGFVRGLYSGIERGRAITLTVDGQSLSVPFAEIGSLARLIAPFG